MAKGGRRNGRQPRAASPARAAGGAQASRRAGSRDRGRGTHFRLAEGAALSDPADHPDGSVRQAAEEAEEIGYARHPHGPAKGGRRRRACASAQCRCGLSVFSTRTRRYPAVRAPYAHPSRISGNPATNHHRRRDAACAQRLAQHHHRDERAGAGSPRRSPTARRRRERQADEAAVALPAGKAAAG